jgi:NTE family protein
MINPFKYFTNRKVGLVLGSGGAKGISHIAVIEYIEAHDIPIHYIAGSSIGAVVGALYSTGKLNEYKNFLLELEWSEMITYFDPVFPKSGLIEGKKIIDMLERFIPRDYLIEDLPVPLSIVATDYYTGMPVVFRSGRVLDAIRASISIPGVFIPMRYKDTFLVDGGVANPLPIDIVKGMGAGRVIAVNLHPILHSGRKKLRNMVESKIKTVEGDSNQLEMMSEKKTMKTNNIKKSGTDKNWIDSVQKWLGIDVNEKSDRVTMPNIFEVMYQTVDIMEYTNTLFMIRYNPPTVLIEPNLVDMPALDFTKTSKILTEGYSASSKNQKALDRKIKWWV